ncbi:hypothetical protein ROZALSC1DRAFT_28906, partial [Rozella allomycis CSF55]
YNIKPSEVLRLIGANKYYAKDILQVLSKKDTALQISNLLSQGYPISGLLEKHGIKPKSRLESQKDYVLMNEEDFVEPGKAFLKLEPRNQ